MRTLFLYSISRNPTTVMNLMTFISLLIWWKPIFTELFILVRYISWGWWADEGN